MPGTEVRARDVRCRRGSRSLGQSGGGTAASSSTNVPYAESVGTLVDLKSEGKIEHIGLSNVTEAQLREAQGLTTVVSIQNRFNLEDRASDALVDVCEQESMVFLPWAPIQDLRDDKLVAVATRHGATPRQVVLAWLLQRSPAMLPLPGTGSVEHLESNVAAAALELSRDEHRALS